MLIMYENLSVTFKIKITSVNISNEDYENTYSEFCDELRINSDDFYSDR